jgi:pyridoxine 4-dehydrogenase
MGPEGLAPPPAIRKATKTLRRRACLPPQTNRKCCGTVDQETRNRAGTQSNMNTANINAAASGTFQIGSDLTIHRLGFGAMRITGPGIWGAPRDPEESKRVLRRCLELGVNFIDTADSYGPGVSEELIAEALHPYPAGLVIATKGGLTRQGPDQWLPVGRPEYLRQQAEMSLRRLRLERIDLYQLHRIDAKVPAEESLGELKDLQSEGKIRHIGLSEVTPEEIERARKTVDIVSVQNKYNLTDREHEPALQYCEEHRLGFIPWFPVAAGKLARPGGPLDDLARRHGATVAQLSLAWLLHRSPVMLPIPGTSSVKHLEENVAAAAIRLPDEEWAKLERQAAA